MLLNLSRHFCTRIANFAGQAIRQHSSSAPPASVWALGKLNHVAIAVPDLDQATSLYRDMLGASVSPPQVL